MLNIFSTNVPQRIKRQIDAIKYLSLTRYRLGIEGDDRVPTGAYSVYFQKGAIGIKVVHGSFGPVRVGGSKSLHALRRSRRWREAVKEYNLLKQVETSTVTPMVYAVKPIRVGNVFFAAIFMQHIDGIPYDVFYENTQAHTSRTEERANYNKIKEALKKIKKLGVINHDAGGSNIIITKHKGNRIISLKIIDFSPELIEKVKRRRR